MYVNGNLGQLVSNTVGPGFGDPVELGLTIPGTSVPVDIQPATTQLTNMLVYLAIAAVVLYAYRSR